MSNSDTDPSQQVSTGDDSSSDPCAISNSTDDFGLRIGSIFVILVTSLVGTMLPIFLRRSRVVPRPVFEFAKFFGSGVRPFGEYCPSGV